MIDKSVRIPLEVDLGAAGATREYDHEAMRGGADTVDPRGRGRIAEFFECFGPPEPRPMVRSLCCPSDPDHAGIEPGADRIHARVGGKR